MHNANEVCKQLGITIWTLTNWYQWQRISLKDGTLDEPILPEPIKEEGVKGKPRMWSDEQIEELREFQKQIVRGRNAIMAKVPNPKSRRAKNS